MVDFHGRCGSGKSAIQYVKELEPYKPMFMKNLSNQEILQLYYRSKSLSIVL